MSNFPFPPMDNEEDRPKPLPGGDMHQPPRPPKAPPVAGEMPEYPSERFSAKDIAAEIKTLEEFFPKAIEQVLIKAAVDYYLLEDRVNHLGGFEDYLDRLESLASESAEKKTEYESQCDANGHYIPLVAAEKRFKEIWDIKFPQQQGQYPSPPLPSLEGTGLNITYAREEDSDPAIYTDPAIYYSQEQSDGMVEHVRNALLSADPAIVEKARNGFVDQLMALEKRHSKLEKQTEQSGFWNSTIALNQEVHMKYLSDKALTDEYAKRTKDILNYGE